MFLAFNLTKIKPKYLKMKTKKNPKGIYVRLAKDL